MFIFCDSPNATGSVETLDDQTETESVVSFRRERPRHRESMDQHGKKKQVTVLITKRDNHYNQHYNNVKMLTESKHINKWRRFVIFKRKPRQIWTWINIKIPSAASQVLVWMAKVDWSATWQDMRAPAPWWAASWRPPASATLRTMTPWAGEKEKITPRLRASAKSVSSSGQNKLIR